MIFSAMDEVNDELHADIRKLKADRDTLAQRLQEAERDAKIGAVAWKFIDRMSNHCQQDPAGEILDEFVKAVMPAINQALAEKP